MQIGNIAQFENLSQFKDLKDFNNNVEQWMLDIKEEYTKSELVALKRLIRFSAKVVGICSAKIGTIVSATHEYDGAGISRSTFKRMIVKSKRLGLLAVYDTTRKNGSKSANVYVFNRFCGQAEPSKGGKMNQPKSNNLSKTNNHNLKIRKEVSEVEKKVNPEEKEFKQEQVKLDASFVSEYVPVRFKELVKCFFNDAKSIEEYWKVAIISARTQKVEGNIVDTAINSFKVMISKLKKGKRIENTYGFYWGILQKKLKVQFFKEAFNSWLGGEDEAEEGFNIIKKRTCIDGG